MKKRTSLYAFAFMVSLGLLGAHTAQAAWSRWDHDNDHEHDNGWHEHARKAHEWHNRHWHNGHVIYERNEPYVTYAPPVVVEPPMPAYNYDNGQPDVNLVFPLNFN